MKLLIRPSFERGHAFVYLLPLPARGNVFGALQLPLSRHALSYFPLQLHMIQLFVQSVSLSLLAKPVKLQSCRGPRENRNTHWRLPSLRLFRIYGFLGVCQFTSALFGGQFLLRFSRFCVCHLLRLFRNYCMDSVVFTSAGAALLFQTLASVAALKAASIETKQQQPATPHAAVHRLPHVCQLLGAFTHGNGTARTLVLEPAPMGDLSTWVTRCT